MRALIAEDDLTSRRVLESHVRGFGHEVCSAGDGHEAWEKFRSGDFNFVLTDWAMPRMDGVELCRHIRSHQSGHYVYVIMVTSRDGTEEIIQGMEAGADEFIFKPVNSRILQVRMRAAERILTLQYVLREKNEQLETTNRRLQQLSRLDPLMKIGNRAAFDEAICHAQENARRYESGYAVVMCDVDFFKSYNDHFGHLAGDQVLRQVAAAIKSCLRANDSAFRYGGEEIVVLLPQQGEEGAAATAERLRAAVEALQIPRSDAAGRPCVTISCGVGLCEPEHGNFPEWRTVLESSDQALYRAKGQGRNCVAVAEPVEVFGLSDLRSLLRTG